MLPVEVTLIPRTPAHQERAFRHRRGCPGDGASSLRVFVQIVLPLCKPAVAAVATLGFIQRWNALLAAPVYVKRAPARVP